MHPRVDMVFPQSLLINCFIQLSGSLLVFVNAFLTQKPERKGKVMLRNKIGQYREARSWIDG
jgi:hypothetical protein